MEVATLETIKMECEKIERGTGHGSVLIKIRNGAIYVIQPAPTILVDTIFDKEVKCK